MSHIIFFLIFLFVVTLIFHDFYYWQLYNLRQFLAPVLIVSFLSYLKMTFELTKNMISYILNVLVILILIGIFFSVTKIWYIIDLTSFFSVKGIPTFQNMRIPGTPAMFYEPALNYSLRLVSTILDPISFGHILTSGFVTLYFIKGIVKNRKIYLFLILFGPLLTMSKLQFFQLILCLTLFNSKLNFFLRFLIPLIVLISGYFLIDLRGIIIHFYRTLLCYS